MRVLLCVDDPSDRAALREAASSAGLEVEEAGGVQGAAASARKGNVDIAVADIEKALAGFAGIPYVFALARDPGAVARALPNGVTDVLPAPVDAGLSSLRLRRAAEHVHARGEADALRTWKRAEENPSKVAHKINNPLSAILGNIEWLRSRGDCSAPDVEECLADAYECAGRIRDIVLDFSKSGTSVARS